MSVRLSPEPTPARSSSRDPRAEAERALTRGLDLLAGVALAMDGTHADDTPNKAQMLADMMEAGIGQAVTARRLFLERAGVR